MKKALSLILALVLCLSLCACGGDNIPDYQPEDDNANVDKDMNTDNVQDNLYVVPGTSSVEVALYMYDGEWTVEGGLDAGLPTKLKFQSDGTCVATYPDRQESLCWGYAPGTDILFYDLYVRVGTQDNVQYLFHIHQEGTKYDGFVARHGFASEDSIPVEGLPEDGYEAVWYTAKYDHKDPLK